MRFILVYLVCDADSFLFSFFLYLIIYLIIIYFIYFIIILFYYFIILFSLRNTDWEIEKETISCEAGLARWLSRWDGRQSGQSGHCRLAEWRYEEVERGMAGWVPADMQPASPSPHSIVEIARVQHGSSNERLQLAVTHFSGPFAGALQRPLTIRLTMGTGARLVCRPSGSEQTSRRPTGTIAARQS